MNTNRNKGIAVDGWCSSNPGKGGYRGVDIETGKELFRWQTDITTNNLVEFLAIVHAAMYQKKHNIKTTIWSDSLTAIAWVRNAKCKTTFDLTKNTELKERIEKSYNYLQKNKSMQICKWQTKSWGEIPADFGRK